eukprot:m.146877 g.146877  ORF g.146877 m.146877 type:complete len:477 (+) comp11651_c2_seq13:203-1633(+)
MASCGTPCADHHCIVTDPDVARESGRCHHSDSETSAPDCRALLILGVADSGWTWDRGGACAHHTSDVDTHGAATTDTNPTCPCTCPHDAPHDDNAYSGGDADVTAAATLVHRTASVMSLMAQDSCGALSAWHACAVHHAGTRPPPRAVDPQALLTELGLSVEARAAAMLGLGSREAVATITSVLTSAQCANLCTAVDTEWRMAPDSVDGAPDVQLNLSPDRLAELIGATAARRVLRLGQATAASNGALVLLEGTDTHQGDDASTHVTEPAHSGVEPQIFVRRYTVSERPWNPFHVDAAAITVNIALVDDDTFEGGRLLACYDGQVRALKRAQGDATVHSSTLLHGVSRLRHGRRYSLIVFFGLKAAAVPTALRFTPASRRDEATALRALCTDTGILGQCRAVLPTGFLRQDDVDHVVSMTRVEDLGQCIETVVGRYAAPHLRPMTIQTRAEDAADSGWCWSLRALLRYLNNASVTT